MINSAGLIKMFKDDRLHPLNSFGEMYVANLKSFKAENDEWINHFRL